MVEELEECFICKSVRLPEFLGAVEQDTSKEYNINTGTMFRTIRFCNDRKECTNAAVQLGKVVKL